MQLLLNALFQLILHHSTTFCAPLLRVEAMGKKQHQKDKLYLSRSEGVQEGGGKVNQIQFMSKSILPFDHCALSLAPVSDPVCTPDGTVFDIT